MIGKKKTKFSKLIVSFVIISNIVFTLIVLAVYWHTGSEPSTLIGSWFGFTTIELWSMSKIERKKIDKES